MLPDGRERDVIVHRKGATPAGAGVLGIIPGSMAAPGYVVRGQGVRSVAALGVARRRAEDEPHEGQGSSSRGRTRSASSASASVKLLSAGLDEVPMAYKDIDEVMAAQRTPGGHARPLRPAAGQDGAGGRSAGGLTKKAVTAYYSSRHIFCHPTISSTRKK